MLAEEEGFKKDGFLNLEDLFVFPLLNASCCFLW